MTPDINRSWDKLYSRLKEEGLLVAESEKKKTIPLMLRMQMAAAIAALCIFSGAISLYMSSTNKTPSIISIYNDDVSNTLVRTLEDGSIVYLSGGAALSCPEQFAADKRQVALQGEALFEVQGKSTQPFLIETEAALVEVTGTRFNVKSSGKESFELSVQHGSVKVTLKTTGMTLVAEGGETVLLQDERLHKNLSDDQFHFARYTEKMQFKDEQLDHILIVIGKISEKPIVVFDNDLKNKEITISFDDNTIEEMIELLCLGFDLKYTDNGKEIVISQQ